VAERLVFDIFAIDNASKGFIAAGRAASATSDDVAKLARRLDEIGTKSAEARIGLKGNKDALAQLDQLQFRLLKLGEKTSKPNVSLEGFAKASAEIAALSVQMDRLNEKSRGSSGLLSRLLGSGPGGGGLLGKLFPEGAGAAGGPGLGLGLGIAAAVPAVEALLVEVTGLASGLAAATLGVGAFGLLALPTFKAVTTAYTGITAAQKAYTAAQQLQKEDPTAAHAKAAELALDKLKIAQQNQPPLILKIVSGIQGLVMQFDRMAKALQPDILKVFNLGLKAASELLPVLLPLAQQAAPAIEGLLKQLGGFFKLDVTTTKWEGFGRSLHSVTVTTLTPFGQFMKTIGALVGPSITAIGEGFGRVAVALGKLLTVMSKKDVVHAINILFDAMVIAIDAVIIIVKRLMNNWDSLSNAFRTARHDIAHWLDLMRQDFEATRAWIEKNFVQVLVRFFTSTLPLAFDLWKESVRFVFDLVKLKALDTVLGISVAFGHLPGPLGAPFRAASTAIRGELAKIQADAANAASNINADWDKLHGKKVTLAWQIAGPSGNIGSAPPHAAGGMIRGGIPGRDSVLGMLMPGEVIVPAPMVRAGAVDHLRGRLPGFAVGGTVAQFTGQFPSAGQIGAAEGAAQNAFNSAFAAWARKAQGAMPAVPGGVAGPGGGAPFSNMMLAIGVEHPSAAQFAAWNYVAMRESGWNQFARNPSSGAYGIAQALPESKYPFAGTAAGGSNPMAQITWMWNYMQQRYGGPVGAAAHEAAFNWYDGGGRLPVGASLSLNTSGRAESVLGSRAEDLLDELCGLVGQLIGVTAAVPSATSAGLGGALSAGSRRAGYRALYS
jgi:hypothetical protein